MNKPHQNQGALSSKLGGARHGQKQNGGLESWRGVFFEGPESHQDLEGEEISFWFVYIGDKDAEPLGKVYRCHSIALAEALVRRMAEDRHLEAFSNCYTNVLKR